MFWRSEIGLGPVGMLVVAEFFLWVRGIGRYRAKLHHANDKR